MGGPWRARDYDPAGWRPLKPRGDAAALPGTPDSAHDGLTATVVAYIASLATSIAIIVTLLKAGW